MKILYFVVEGDTEERFVKDLLSTHFENVCYIQPIKITTNPNLGKRGGFTTYKHLKTDVENLLRQKRDKIVTSFVDYFKIPQDTPNYNVCRKLPGIDERIECLEKAVKADIADERFFPYIQKHEFEALLFSSNAGFEYCYDKKTTNETAKIIKKYPNPELINDNPNTSPSNRLKTIIPFYDKDLEGNTIALEVGLEAITEKCPRFRHWLKTLIDAVKE